MTYTIPQLPPHRAWMAIYSDTVYCRPEIASAVLAAIQRVSPAAYIHVPRPGFTEYPDGSRADTVKIHPCCEGTVLARAAVRNCLHGFNQWILPSSKSTVAKTATVPTELAIKSTQPRPSLAELDAVVTAALATYTEPDGVQGYEYTIEARYGVAVGADWLPVAMRRKVAVSLFHPAMLCEAA